MGIARQVLEVRCQWPAKVLPTVSYFYGTKHPGHLRY